MAFAIGLAVRNGEEFMKFELIYNELIEIEETLISMTKDYRDRAAAMLTSPDPFVKGKAFHMLEEIARLEYLLTKAGISIDPCDEPYHKGDH